MRPFLYKAIFLLLLLNSCTCNPEHINEVAKIVIKPGSVLLTKNGDTSTLTAEVTDISGQLVEATVTWRSTNEASVSVTNNGEVKANTELGSAQVIASVNNIESAPILVLVATPADGAVLFSDEQVINGPIAVDDTALFGPGFQTKVTFGKLETNPSQGDIMIGKGESPIAGRVISAVANGENTEVVLEMVPLQELFSAIALDESIDLSKADYEFPEETRQAYDIERDDAGGVVLSLKSNSALRASQLGQGQGTRLLEEFECEFTGQLQLSLVGLAPSIRINPNLTYNVNLRNQSLQKATVTGSIDFSSAINPRINGAFEAKVECKKELMYIRLPIGGPLGLFLGGMVPLGRGFEVSGKATFARFGVDISLSTRASVEAGIDCSSGECSGVGEMDVSADSAFNWAFPDPETDFRFEPTVAAFLTFDLRIGNPFIRRLQIKTLKSKAGVKFSGNMTSRFAQAKDEAYASDYSLNAFYEVSAVPTITALEDLLQVSLASDLFKFSGELPLSQSPAGTFYFSDSTVEPGESITASITLDAERLQFLSIDNISDVEIYRLDEDQLKFKARLQPTSPGQTDFSWSWTPTEEDEGTQTFVAFVKPNALSFVSLEVSKNSKQEITVGQPIEADILFECLREGEEDRNKRNICIISPDGSGLRVLPRYGHAPTWSPDHSKVSFNWLDFDNQGSWRDEGCYIFDLETEIYLNASAPHREGFSGTLNCWAQVNNWTYDNNAILTCLEVPCYWLKYIGDDSLSRSVFPDRQTIDLRSNPALSPTRNQFLFTNLNIPAFFYQPPSNFGGTLLLGTLPVDSGTPIITEPNKAIDKPIWSDDGNRIAYLLGYFTDAGATQNVDLVVTDVEGSEKVTVATSVGLRGFTYRFSPDGEQIAVLELDVDDVLGRFGSYLEVVSVNDPTQRKRILEPIDSVVGPFDWSPDGQSIVYTSGAANSGVPNQDGFFRKQTLRIIEADGTNDRDLTGTLPFQYTILPHW